MIIVRILPNVKKIYLNYASTSFPKSKTATESFFKALTTVPCDSRQHCPNGLYDQRQRVGKVLNISAEHIFFTPSATLALNQVIRGYAKENTCVAIDNRSHNAVIKSMLSLNDRCKCMVAPLYDERDLLLENRLLEVLSESPRLLCLSHVSNVNGSVYPVEDIIDLVQAISPSTAVLVDASQSAGAVTLSRLHKADFIVFPAHKHLHAFDGAAVLVAKKPLKPVIFGGTGSSSASENETDQLFTEVGTFNIPAIKAMVDSLEFAESELLSHRKLENELVSQFLEGIHQIEELEVLPSQASDRVGIVALVPKYGSPELHWVPFLKSQDIFVRGGVQCSPIHHEQLGLARSGTLRFSFGWDTTPLHIEKALAALKEFSNAAKRIF